MTKAIYGTCSRCERYSQAYRIAGRERTLAYSCGHQVSIFKDTPLFKSTTKPELWQGIFNILKKDQTLNCKQIERLTGVTYKTAWRMKNVIIKNLAWFDNYYNPTQYDWEDDDKKQFSLREIEAVWNDIDTRMEFNYRQEAKNKQERISLRYAQNSNKVRSEYDPSN